jgi:hypothetical protein
MKNTIKETKLNNDTNIGKIIKYSTGSLCEIIDENKTHMLIKFADGSKFCVLKDRYNL